MKLSEVGDKARRAGISSAAVINITTTTDEQKFITGLNFDMEDRGRTVQMHVELTPMETLHLDDIMPDLEASVRRLIVAAYAAVR